MAIAGRVAIVPKGEYSNAVTYDKLDLVMHNGNAYIAKKQSTGIEPTNEEYWMLILNNVVAEDLENIINGTTPVGKATDADTVDGYDANANGKKGLATILQDYGIMEIGSIIDFHTEDGQDYKVRLFIDGANLNIHKTGQAPATLIDSNGGTINGALDFKVGNYKGAIIADSELIIRNITDEATNTYTNIGIGDGRIGIAKFSNGNLSMYGDVLHTGNKPTGSYTGNGSATSRTINTGGIGSELLFRCGGEVGLFSKYGGVVFNSGMSQVFYFTAEEMKFENGVLTLATASVYVNDNGGSYEYRVL